MGRLAYSALTALLGPALRQTGVAGVQCFPDVVTVRVNSDALLQLFLLLEVRLRWLLFTVNLPNHLSSSRKWYSTFFSL